LKFIKDTLTTFTAQIIAVVLALVVTIVVARVLGPSGKGAYALIILIPTLLALVGNLGIGIASVYYGGKKKYDWADLASNSLVSAVALGIPLALAFLAYFLVFHPSFLRDIEPHYIVIALLIVPFSLLTGYFSMILLGQGRIRQYNLLQVAPGVVSLVLILTLLLAFRGGILGVIIASVTAALVSALLSALLVRKATRITWAFHPGVFKESLRFGVQGYLSNVIQFLNYRLDMLMVAYFMTTASVGYYSISVAMAETLWYFPAAVGTIIFARTPGLSAEEANRTTPRICRNTLFITALAALALLGLSRYIIPIFWGSAFLPALKPLWILLPGIVALVIWKVLANEMAGRGKPIINAYAAGVSLAVNVLLNLLLIPRWGISGAAFASSVSYTVTAVIVLTAFLRISKNSWVDTVVVKPQDLRIYTGVLAKINSRFQLATGNSRVK